MSNADSPRSPETPPAADDTPIRPMASSLAATTPNRAVTPRHPMPATFPEVRLPTNPPPTNALAPAVIDPHSIHDGRGYQSERLVCIRCGSTNVARGQIVQHSTSFQNSYFAPRRVSLRRLNSLLNLFPFRALLKLDAIACRDCGAVLTVIDPAALRKVEKIRD